jgi:MYXO-CTERM domain-containing protein
MTVTWMDGDAVLGTGMSLAAALGPGLHTITVVVDDGTESAAVSLDIVVEKEGGGSPGPGPAAALAAVALGALVASRRKR